MYPAEEQIVDMNKHFGACRFIYYWGLKQKIKNQTYFLLI